MALIVLPRALMTCPRLASRPRAAGMEMKFETSGNLEQYSLSAISALAERDDGGGEAW
jgi:hypothetical protein